MQGVELYGNLPCLGTREKLSDGGLGEYVWMSYDEVSRRAENCGSGLKKIASDIHDERSEMSSDYQRMSEDSIIGAGGGMPPSLSGGPADHVGTPPLPRPRVGTAGTWGLGSPKAPDMSGGLLRGSHVGILAENCPQWVIVDHACAKYSLVSVPLETYGRDCFTKLLQNSATTVIFASRSWMPSIFDNYKAGACPALRFVVQVSHGLQLQSIWRIPSAAVGQHVFVQIERLEYEEQVRAKELGLPIYDFAFVEKTGERNRRPVEPPHTDDVFTIAYRWHTNNCEPIGWQVPSLRNQRDAHVGRLDRADHLFGTAAGHARHAGLERQRALVDLQVLAAGEPIAYSCNPYG